MLITCLYATAAENEKLNEQLTDALRNECLGQHRNVTCMLIFQLQVLF